MPGFMPGIHVFLYRSKTWMAGTSPAMTTYAELLPLPVAPGNERNKGKSMPKRLNLTLACGDYEIIRPLLRGKVEVDGVDLTILSDMDSATRHWRFLNNNEFDIAEVSSSSYLAARDNDLPFRAIPVFLHRRFRHGFMFINTSKGITKPADLRGRKIGVKTMMTTRGALDARHPAARIWRAAQQH